MCSFFPIPLHNHGNPFADYGNPTIAARTVLTFIPIADANNNGLVIRVRCNNVNDVAFIQWMYGTVRGLVSRFMCAISDEFLLNARRVIIKRIPTKCVRQAIIQQVADKSVMMSSVRFNSEH